LGRACRKNGENNLYRIFVKNGRRIRDHEEDQDVGGRIVLKWILERWCGLNWSGSGCGLVEGSCEEGNEPSVSVKCSNILQ
jgi:hypothetical protein